MPNDKEKASGAVVTLRERYLIFPASPLPDLALPSAQAFMAEDRRERDRALFAYVVKPGFPVRASLLRLLKGVENPGLLTLVEWGVADWTPAGRKAMVLIYVRPLGGRLWDGKTSNVPRLDEAETVRRIIQPAVSALKQLKQLGLTHRSIRPSNMFWLGPDKERAVFGDGGAVPPAFEQPASIEPIESALAMPGGRGEGTSANDIYSFGASLAIILQGRDITAAQTEEAVIRHKMVMGSYSALAGEARLPLPLVEILRGMLCDDANERWGIEAMDLWLNGRRLTPLVPRVEKKAIRAFTLNGKNYMTARELAMGIAQNWDGVLPHLGEGKLELWVGRALDNKEKAATIGNAIADDGGFVDRRVAADYAVAKICMILDPMAPIRFKGMSVMIDGFRWLLPMAVAGNGDVKTIAEALIREVPKAWFTTREAYNPDNSVMETLFRTQKGYLDRAAIGAGVERVLYEMNDAVPCLSPMLADDYVLELRDLLPAMNNYAKKKGETSTGSAMDRHLAAFIAARANFDVERIIADLSLPDPGRQLATVINLFAMIQWRVGQAGMTSLSQWLAHLAKPAIKGFFNRAKRESLEGELPKAGLDGNIVELSRLLDSAEEKGADRRGFEEAKAQWAEAFRQARDIEDGSEEIHDEATKTGQQLASLISITTAFLAVAFLLVEMIF